MRHPEWELRLMRLDWKQTFGFVLTVVLTSFFLVANFCLAQERAATTNGQSMVLRNATLHTMAGQGTFIGDVLVSDGKIKAIGKKVEVPDQATVYDLEGCHVVPGLIESRGKLWLTKAATVEANSKAELNVLNAIDPWSEDWRELASQGITAVYVQPGSTSSLGGYGAVMRVAPHELFDEVVLKKEVAIQAAIGIKGATSKDRMTQFKALEKLIESAKEKKKEPKADDKKSKADPEKESKTGDNGVVKKKETPEKDAQKKTKDSSQKPESKAEKKEEKEKDPTKIALRRVLKKEVPLFVEVHHSDALEKVLGLAKKFNIRLIVGGLSQVASASGELKDSNIPFVVGPFLGQKTTPAFRKEGNLDWLSRDFDSDQLFSLSGFPTTARGSRLLRSHAAAAIGTGVNSEVALSAITSHAARMLGIGEQRGTLEIGKLADIAVFAGDPLDPSSPTRLVMSQGKITFERDATAGDSDSVESVALPADLPSNFAVKTSRMLSGGKFIEATIVVADGKIVSVGKQAKLDGVRLYDLADTILSPGLVVASSSLGQSAALGDAMESDSSHLRSVDAVDPTKKQAKEMLAGGFVHIGLSPGRTNTSAGVIGHVRLGSGDYVVNPAIASQFVLSKSARKNDRFPASINGQLQLINGLFAGKTPTDTVYVSSAIRRSIQHEKLANINMVAEGNRKAIMVADSNQELRSAISLAKKHGLSPSLLSSGRVGDFAKRLAEQNFGMIVSPLADDAYDSQLEQIVTAVDAGLPLAFAGETAEKIRMTAALLVNAGVPRETVLKAMTEGGGDVVGMNHVRLKQGGAADFVVWSGSPLNLSSKPLTVVVGGKPVTPK